MSWLVYILRSDKDGELYKGITEDIQRRLEEHNSGKSRFTSSKTPWQLVYQKERPNTREAMIEEKRLKRLNWKSLEKLLQG